MNVFSRTANDLNALKVFLSSEEIRSSAANAHSVLIQVFTSKNDRTWIESINEAAEELLPEAVLVGSTTVGEIDEGILHIGKTVLTVMFFDSASVNAIAMPCPKGDEYGTGRRLTRAIKETGPDIAGVILLTTPLSVNATDLFDGMSEKGSGYPVFGGGAGVYESTQDSVVFCGKDHYDRGVVAVVLSGRDLHISPHTYLGWQPISKEMTVTETDGMFVQTVDDVRALEIYHRYLDIKNDQNFFHNVLEFPFMMERNGNVIARVPFFAHQNGDIQFVADIKPGEKFRIGYGDPKLIIQNARAIQRKMRDFTPDVVILFSCICRRFLMQSDVNLETQPFKALAPTVGFYTYGEFFGTGNNIQVLNSAMVAVGIREGKRVKKQYPQITSIKPFDADPYANKHSRIVAQFVHFIKVVTSELEQANRELARLAEIDKLTQIYNRLKLDEILHREIKMCERYHTELSVILMDIDNFKQVNDLHGHIAGDNVLVQMANILRRNLRVNDAVGRWGGEEFLLILPHTNLEQACKVAEKIRATIDSEAFPIIDRQTCSFGVTNYFFGDNQDKLLMRADTALYKAKKCGRNRVMFDSLNLNVLAE
ncbi:MAG: sensor domain-containing diguanylate cyclase [Bacillota bacterium]